MAPTDDVAGSWPGFPLPRADMTAQEFTREIGGAASPAVPVTQPPPADMPPLTVMILDALADAAETIYTMRNCGEMVPDGLALVGEAHLLGALRSLMSDGLVEVETEHVVVDGNLIVRRPVGVIGTKDDDLRRYWFRMTPAGVARWEAAFDVLDAYYDAHPSQPSSAR